MNDFIEKFKDGLVIKVERENIEKFLETIQHSSGIHWAGGQFPMDLNPLLKHRQRYYVYIIYNKILRGMQYLFNPKNEWKEIYNFQNYKLDLEEPVIFGKSITEFLTEKCQ